MALTYDLIRSFGYSTSIGDHTAGGAATVLSSGSRSGKGAVRITSGNELRFGLKTSGSTKYIAFAIKPDFIFNGLGTIMKLKQGGTEHTHMRINSGGQLNFIKNDNNGLGQTPPIVIAGQWVHVQMRFLVAFSGGQIEIRVNGSSASVHNASGLTFTGNSVDEITLSSGGGMTIDYCDLVVTKDDWPGDFTVGYYKPNGAGNSTQWTPSAGSNFQTVDEASKDTSDYNATSTVGNKDTFALENVTTPSVIKCVAPIMLADKQDAGAATINAVIRHSGTDYDQSAASPPFGSITYLQPDFLETNPGTAAAWVDTDVNAMELGYKRAS